MTNFEADTPALCRSTDPDIFFPDPMESRRVMGESGRNLVAKTIVALDLCQACPIKAECLQFAMNNRELHGIWGGSMPHERDKVLAMPAGFPVAIPFYTRLREVVLEQREDLVCPDIPKPNREYTPYLEYLPTFSPSSPY